LERKRFWALVYGKLFLKALRRWPRLTRKLQPESRQHLCRFFGGLLRETLRNGGLRPEDIGSSEEELTSLEQGQRFVRRKALPV
jgi:hypothetical protein